jgi:pimeloyl-ACP methyl ester carboxylesterase
MRPGRLILAALAALLLCLAVIYFFFPELVLQAMAASARRSAGLERLEIDVGDHHIVYLTGGAGEPVVLLHGFAASKDLWNTVAARLTPRYRVIAPDIPGFGESPALDEARYDVESQAGRVRALLEALEIDAHHVGGSSMGGLISVAYAALFPDAVRSLMIGGAPGVRSPEKSEVEEAFERGGNPLLVRNQEDFDEIVGLIFHRPPSIPGPVKRAMMRTAIRNHATYTRLFDELAESLVDGLEPLLPGIEAPTLVLWGAEDRLVHPSAVDVFTAGIAGAESEVFEACGHALPRECPERMAERYLAFLSGIDVGTQREP